MKWPRIFSLTLLFSCILYFFLHWFQPTSKLSFFYKEHLPNLNIISSKSPSSYYSEISKEIATSLQAIEIPKVVNKKESEGSLENLKYVSLKSNSVGFCQLDVWEENSKKFEDVVVIGKLYTEKLHIISKSENAVTISKRTDMSKLRTLFENSFIGSQGSGTRTTMTNLINVLNENSVEKINLNDLRNLSLDYSFDCLNSGICTHLKTIYKTIQLPVEQTNKKRGHYINNN